MSQYGAQAPRIAASPPSTIPRLLFTAGTTVGKPPDDPGPDHADTTTVSRSPSLHLRVRDVSAGQGWTLASLGPMSDGPSPYGDHGTQLIILRRDEADLDGLEGAGCRTSFNGEEISERAQAHDRDICGGAQPRS